MGWSTRRPRSYRAVEAEKEYPRRTTQKGFGPQQSTDEDWRKPWQARCPNSRQSASARRKIRPASRRWSGLRSRRGPEAIPLERRVERVDPRLIAGTAPATIVVRTRRALGEL